MANFLHLALSRDLGIDLGTANSLVYVKGKGVILNEPSVVAIRRDSGEILEVGAAAKRMVGRTPGNIVAIRPLKDGVIADFDTTQKMLQKYISTALKGRPLVSPLVVVCVPSGVTEVEKRAVYDATKSAGARDAVIVEEPMAAAIGAGLPVEEPTGNMIVDVGGGTTEVAVISLGGIVTHRSIRVGGDEMDDAIMAYIKRHYNLMIGERTAEETKKSIGSAYILGDEETLEVRGRDLLTGLPKVLEISSVEVREALAEPIRAIIDAVKSTLERTPPELAADIMDRGIMMTGGGSLLKGLDKLISEETGMPVHIAEEPLACVAIGTGKILENSSLQRLVATPGRK